MDQRGFVRYAVIGFGLLFLSFLVRGLTRLVFPTETAVLLSLPIATVGFCLLVYLFVRATLDAVGVWEVERADG
ncbi:hypothetical protein ACFQGT_03715 [Natrialbaceae archaeon GCM10025810]|uniref:hypothetical protein n=1 Tax=Halovalidus salilacus TaxID=3075124 RepID=UPI0036120618